MTKRYGDVIAVDDLSFTLQPGVVTGFLGPNGAGKTTTMRLVLGLDRPTSGTVTVAGRPYRDLSHPLCQVGALLQADALHPSRTAGAHLQWLAASNGLPRTRVGEVLRAVGLEKVAHRRAGGFSLGMRQRLGIAAALLGDPPTLIFDEPFNGLDPEGIVWIRTLMGRLAEQGRTVLVSSHLVAELAQAATRLIVIGRGRLISDSSVEEFLVSSDVKAWRVRSSEPRRLAGLLTHHGATVKPLPDGQLEVRGIGADALADLAGANDLMLNELISQQVSLEDAFMALTRDSVQYRSNRDS